MLADVVFPASHPVSNWAWVVLGAWVGIPVSVGLVFVLKNAHSAARSRQSRAHTVGASGWAPLAALIAASAGLFALLSYTDSRSDAAGYGRSKQFAQAAKAICERNAIPRQAIADTPRWRRHAAITLRRTGEELSRLPEPPNVHRAVARVVHDWRALAAALEQGQGPGSDRYDHWHTQSIRAAHLLDITACLHFPTG
jgi:hypothetical protein